MSSTNPTPGKDPVSVLAPTAPGQPAPDEHDRAGPPDAAVIARGYEADTYDRNSVISVPILVLTFFFLAFVTVTIMFKYMEPTPNDPNAHPLAVNRNNPDLNDRMRRIHRGGEVDQPRLEPLKLRADEKDKPARGITRPELPTGNSPELHPEDIRPSPENTPALYRKTDGRIPLDEAMDAALKNGTLLKAAKDGHAPVPFFEGPTAANAGRGLPAHAAEVKH